jgi:hypothetical protein
MLGYADYLDSIFAIKPMIPISDIYVFKLCLKSIPLQVLKVYFKENQLKFNYINTEAFVI